MTTNLLSVIEQLVGALETLAEHGAYSMSVAEPALAAGQQALEQTQVEAEPEWNDENVIAYCIARGISAAKAFTTGATQPQVEPAPKPPEQGDTHHWPQQGEPAPSPEVLQALTDPENQPNQFGVVFGMHGPRMFFAIGNQSFDLAYEPDEPEEFEFMKRMLCSAFYTFTPDVKTVPAPSTAGERAQVVEDLLMYAGDNGYSHIDYADTMRHAAALLQSTADHIAEQRKLVAALPVGELTLEQITRIYDRYGGDMVNCTRAIERELAAARSQPTTEESSVVDGAQPVREPLTPDTHYQEWKHGCDSMCTNITLWIDRCPHCGKPRPVVEAAHGITKKGGES